MLEILCKVGVGAWLSTHLMILFFLVGFRHFLHYIAHLVGPSPSFNPWFVTLHLCPTFGPYGDSTFHYAHDVVSDAFAFIAKDARFHVLHEQTHVHSPLVFQSSCK
jgi:hypothetical protein